MMEKVHKAKLANDLFIVNSDVYCVFKNPESRKGFKLSDVLGWLSSVKEDPSRELRKKVIEELDIINLKVKSLLGNNKTISWLKARKDVVDKIDRAEEFELFMRYERRGGIFFRTPSPPSHFSKVDIRAELNFIVRDDYNRFYLDIGVPTPSHLPDMFEKIKDTVNRIVSDLIENKKINGDHVTVHGRRSIHGGPHYLSTYEAEINEINISEAAEMVLGIIEGTKEVLEELKRYYF